MKEWYEVIKSAISMIGLIFLWFIAIYLFLILGGFLSHWLTDIFKFGWNLFG